MARRSAFDRYVRRLAPANSARQDFERFPTWMWRNEEVLAFLDWLRLHNENLPIERRTAFRGLDVYGLGASIKVVLSYLDRVDPNAASGARRRYGCLTHGKTSRPITAAPPSTAKTIRARRRQSRSSTSCSRAGSITCGRTARAFFDAAQNARIVRAAERYYRIMYRGGNESWNLRDRHMFDTLQALLRAGGPEARAPGKAVVWAHNSHIGNAAATAMGWQGEFNIGELCRTAYGDEAVSIGFGTDRGIVAAADD